MQHRHFSLAWSDFVIWPLGILQVQARPNKVEFIYASTDAYEEKLMIIFITLTVCVTVAVFLSLVNVKSDFQDIFEFYTGFQGRKLLIKENTLQYRDRPSFRRVHSVQIPKLTPVKEIDISKAGIEAVGHSKSGSSAALGLGHVNTILMEDDIQEKIYELALPGQVIQQPENKKQSTASKPKEDKPLITGIRYIEDEEPEWKDADYTLQLGEPPNSFLEFLLQYDWDVWTLTDLPFKDMMERKLLYEQFREWKSRKRRRYNIIVTSRAKKDMSDNEKNQQKKLQQKTSLRHAELHREAMAKKYKKLQAANEAKS